MERIIDSIISLAALILSIAAGTVVTLLVLSPFFAVLLGIFTFWGWGWFFAIPFVITIVLLIILLGSIDDDDLAGVTFIYIVWSAVVIILAWLALSTNLG